MAHARITIDGATLLDANLGEWTRTLPDILQQQLNPGAQPQPWMKALLLMVAEAAAGNQPFQADVTTRDNGWVLDVTHA